MNVAKLLRRIFLGGEILIVDVDDLSVPKEGAMAKADRAIALSDKLDGRVTKIESTLARILREDRDTVHAILAGDKRERL